MLAKEVEATHKIANVIIHVEHVIGLVQRKYVILQSILPIEYVKSREGETLSPIDRIAIVCCVSNNLTDYIPFD